MFDNFTSICDDSDRKTVHSYYRQHSTPALSAPPPELKHQYSQSLRQVTTFNFLMAHQLLKTRTLLWECCIVYRQIHCTL